MNRDDFCKIRSLSSKGIQSEVDIGSMGDRLIIRKRSGRGLSKSYLELSLKCMKKYHTSLMYSAFSIPEIFFMNLINSDNDILLEIMEEYVEAPTVDQIIRGDDYPWELKEMTWTVMLQSLIENFLRNHSAYRTEIMIDAKAPNFIWHSKENKLYYIDLFPPLLRDMDGQVYPFKYSLFKRSRMLFTFNYGDIRGQVTKLLALIRIEYPSDCHFLTELTLRIVKDKLPALAADYILLQAQNAFPHMSLFYSSDKEEADNLLRKLLM